MDHVRRPRKSKRYRLTARDRREIERAAKQFSARFRYEAEAEVTTASLVITSAMSARTPAEFRRALRTLRKEAGGTLRLTKVRMPVPRFAAARTRSVARAPRRSARRVARRTVARAADPPAPPDPSPRRASAPSAWRAP